MSNVARKPSADARIRQIEEQQNAIKKYLRNVIYELDRLHSGEIVNYWMVIEGSYRSTTYKKELEKTLKRLRRQLAALKRQRREIRLAVLHNNAKKVKNRNHLAIKQILKKAEKRGELSSDEERKVIRRAEETLRTFMGVLDQDPSEANVKGVLDALADFMMVGGEEAGVDVAFGALGRAAERRYRVVEKEFREKPTIANFEKLLMAHAEGSLTSDDFMESPPDPVGWRPALPGTVHTVAPGDTLAGISLQYYGSPSYWDIIFRENYGVIGDNIGYLQPSTPLRIP